MKRDMDLIRQILFAVEELPATPNWRSLDIEGYAPEEISYHVKLLAQARLIEAQDMTAKGQGLDWRPHSLTWQGHEFLNAARDDSRWQTAKALVITQSGCLVFEILQQCLMQSIRAAVFPSSTHG